MGHRTQIILEDDHYRFLKRKSEEEGVSIAQIVRQLIEAKMKEKIDYKKSPLLSIEPVDTGRRDASVRHDDYIYRRKK